jgi:hypothetical protein
MLKIFLRAHKLNRSAKGEYRARVLSQFFFFFKKSLLRAAYHWFGIA